MYVYRDVRAFPPQSFWLRRKGRKGAACLEARIGLDQLNVDLSQSANNRSPVPNLSIDLVSSYNFNVAFHAALDIAIQFARRSPALGPFYLYRFLRAATLYFNCKIRNYQLFVFEVTFIKLESVGN